MPRVGLPSLAMGSPSTSESSLRCVVMVQMAAGFYRKQGWVAGAGHPVAQRRFPAKMTTCLQLWLKPGLQAFNTTARQTLDQGCLCAPWKNAKPQLLAIETDSASLEMAMEMCRSNFRSVETTKKSMLVFCKFWSFKFSFL